MLSPVAIWICFTNPPAGASPRPTITTTNSALNYNLNYKNRRVAFTTRRLIFITYSTGSRVNSRVSPVLFSVTMVTVAIRSKVSSLEAGVFL